MPINFFDVDNQPLTGVTLANRINEEFSAVSQEYTPLRPLLRTNEDLDCPVEYIISEDDVYGTLTFLSLLDRMISRIIGY